MKTMVIAYADADARADHARVARGAGFEVLEATDGLDALHKCCERKPDIAVFDALLPVMSGLEVAQSLAFEMAFGSLPKLDIFVRAARGYCLPWETAFG